MIYLIDDKRERQEKYGVNFEFFKEYENILKPFWTYEEMEEKRIRNEIVSGGNIIFFHESFFKNHLNANFNTDFTLTRHKLINLVKCNKNTHLVFFSGSISSRDVDDNIIYIPVSQFYSHLEIFLKNYKSDDLDIKYLLYGRNPEIEKKIKTLYVKSTNDIDDTPTQTANSSNFFLQQSSVDISINTPLIGAVEEYISDKVDDNKLNEKINLWFNDKIFDNIFIPFCFGSTFSDFNGLRLATLIRCTNSKNQLSKIYIYSFINPSDYLKDLMKHDCFNILKTKNVELIGYSKKEFLESANQQIDKFDIEELKFEMNKLNISIPENYEDNHSIANEFGLYQLAYNAGIDIKEITDFDSEKLESLYFKWLITKNGLHEKLSDEQDDKNKKYRRILRGLKKVGSIDLNKLK